MTETLQLSEEQLEFQSAVRRFLSDHVSAEYLRTRLDNPRSTDPELRNRIEELGLFEYFADSKTRIPARELAILAFESGAALLPENLLDEALYGPLLTALPEVGTDLPASLAGRLSQGQARASRVPIAGTLLSVQDDAGGKRLNGSVSFVPAADAASVFVCSVDAATTVLVESTGQEEHIRRIGEPSLDLLRPSFQVEFSSVPCIVLPTSAAGLLEQLFRMVHGAELAGICARVVSMTVEHVSQRRQFGVPIGGFQAVQHGLADMHARSEALRAAAFFAAWAAEHSRDQLPLSASAAYLYGLRQTPFVVEKAIQLHGGIGFTWEHPLHLYLRRARTLLTQAEASGMTGTALVEMARTGRESKAT